MVAANLSTTFLRFFLDKSALINNFSVCLVVHLSSSKMISLGKYCSNCFLKSNTFKAATQAYYPYF